MNTSKTDDQSSSVSSLEGVAAPTKPPKKSLFRRVQRVLVVFGVLYVFAVALLTVPFFQRHTIYLNALRFPFFADFDAPEKYSLAPNKTLNLYLNTPDNVTLGAWFILSDEYYHALPVVPSSVTPHIAPALRARPTVLFFHGNAATRAFKARVQYYKAFSSRLAANVFAIDYRGFADSTGTPSEAGLVKDARAAWDWLVAHGAQPEDILVMGHSLGTGVSSQLGAQLAKDGIKPRGIVLLAPFTSILTLLDTYHLFGLVPLMQPLSMIPFAADLLKQALTHPFDTLKSLPDITCDVLIAHAEDDWDIPYRHSELLFQAFLEPHLPALKLPENPLVATPNEWAEVNKVQIKREAVRDDILERKELPNFGQVEQFRAGGRNIVYVRSKAGGHDFIGAQEGVQDVIGKTFGFF